MSPGTYTELFFLDEATAFSAGHRPCGYCQRQRYLTFKDAWLQANQHRLEGDNPAISAIDKLIHKERIQRGKKVTFSAPVQSLPSGTMVEIAAHAYLVWDHNLYAWSFLGYQQVKDIPSSLPDSSVTVLTPQSYVNTFQTGFLPRIHHSGVDSITRRRG